MITRCTVFSAQNTGQGARIAPGKSALWTRASFLKPAALALFVGALGCKSGVTEPTLEAQPRMVALEGVTVSIQVPQGSVDTKIGKGVHFAHPTAKHDVSAQLELLPSVLGPEAVLGLISSPLEGQGMKPMVIRKRIEGKQAWFTLHDEGKTNLISATVQPTDTKGQALYCRASIQRAEPIEQFEKRRALLEQICDSAKLVR